MRVMLAISVLFLLTLNANAAVGDRFICYVANVNSINPDGRQDGAFIASNMQKKYEITLLTSSIVAVFTHQDGISSMEFRNIKETPFDIIGTTVDIGANTIAVSKVPIQQYRNMYPASITLQSGFFVNAWLLLCSKQG
jgi:hypothetical protein